MLIHHLTPAQCEELLTRTPIGRLACARMGQPYIVPISFSFDPIERALVSFSSVGQKIGWMRANPKVCVEVDEIVDQFNWASVLVTGRYEEIVASDKARLERAQQLFQTRSAWWLPGAAHLDGSDREAAVFFQIAIKEMSGRRAGS